MQALWRQRCPAKISAVIQQPRRPGCSSLAKGVPTAVVIIATMRSGLVRARRRSDRRIFAGPCGTGRVHAHPPPQFAQRYAGRSIIHPSLLPAFTGIHTHRRALAEGVRLHGCTVHFVTPELDHGPIIAQAAVPVLPDDTESTLAARVLREEHRILPQVVRWFLEDKLSIQGNRVHISGDVRIPQPITSPEQA